VQHDRGGPFDDQFFLRVGLGAEAVSPVLFFHGGGYAMKAERYLDEEATIKKGVDALVRELGPVAAMRFLSLPRERRELTIQRSP
jgi:hypothetical protein